MTKLCRCGTSRSPGRCHGQAQSGPRGSGRDTAAVYDYRNLAETDRQRAETAFKEEAKDRIERAETCEQRADRIEKELPAVQKTVAALEREEAAIREQMLVP